MNPQIYIFLKGGNCGVNFIPPLNYGRLWYHFQWNPNFMWLNLYEKELVVV